MKKSEQVSEKTPTANRQYKDTVFRMLFSEKENLLSLYNAVTGSHYQNAEALKIVTLENAIYMGMKNDLAFMLETNIYLYEHQSTINPNIPLRDLIYIGIEYQQYLNDKSLYSSKLQKIPAPKFMVFYNGTDDVEDRMELKLSSAYEHLAGEPDLELKSSDAECERRTQQRPDGTVSDIEGICHLCCESPKICISAESE